MTLVFDLNIFGWILGAIAFSMLADRIGRRNSILIAVFTFGIFTAAIPLAAYLGQLAAIRFASALGVGGAMPTFMLDRSITPAAQADMASRSALARH